MAASTTSSHLAAGAGSGLLISRLARLARNRVAEALAPVEMRPPEYAVLSQLRREGAISQRGIGRLLRIQPSNLVALLDALEADGLISRNLDAEDRRRRLVSLSALGEARLDAAELRVAEAESELLEPLSAAERRQLHSLLERLTFHGCRPACDKRSAR